MTLKINGATGGSVSLDAPDNTSPAGTNVTLTLPTSAGSNGQYLQTNGNGTLSWQTVEGLPDAIDVNASAPADSLAIDGSGRVLVGLTSDSSNTTLSLQGRSDDSSGGPIVRFKRGEALPTSNVSVGNIFFSDGQDRVGVEIQATTEGNWSSSSCPARFGVFTTTNGTTTPAERFRIQSSGKTHIWGETNQLLHVLLSRTADGSNLLIRGAHSASGIGGGTTSITVKDNGNVENTNNSYGAISDIKLKENIVNASSQWDDLKALQVRNYNFKEETGHLTHTQIGVIAQEVELVSPGLVTEMSDLDAEGNDLGTVTKSVNYSVLYMKAVKALQEAMERIETLEAKVTALEGGAA